MTILNLDNELHFELPFSDGAFDEYIRKIEISEDENDAVLSIMGDEFSMELEDMELEQSNPDSSQSSRISMTRWLVKQRRSSGFG